MNNAVDSGSVVQYTASADISAGDVVVMGSTCGIAITDIANGATGSVAVKGQFTVPIATAALGTAIAQGKILKYDSGASEITAASTLLTSVLIGKAGKAAGTGATTVDVILGL